MYSVILMAAMAGTPDAAGFGWRSGGCAGCYGAYSAGCYGSSCYGSSCHGSSCYGSCFGSSCNGNCQGGGLFPRLRNLFGGLSCRGSACYGSACHGSACYGSCYGSGYGVGCWGSCYGTGCTGIGCTGAGCIGGGFVVGSVETTPAGTFAPTQTVTAARITEPAVSRATLTVELPAEAKLFVDGSAVNGSGPARLYNTPELPAGQAFYYDLKAEVVVNGTPVVEETRAIVRAGEAVTVTFPKLTAAVGGSTNVVAAAK